MGKFYIVCEGPRGAPPQSESPSDIFLGLDVLSNSYEDWYADENYVCLDEEGSFYRMEWDEKNSRMLLLEDKHRSHDRPLFLRLMHKWIEAVASSRRPPSKDTLISMLQLIQSGQTSDIAELKKYSAALGAN